MKLLINNVLHSLLLPLSLWPSYLAGETELKLVQFLSRRIRYRELFVRERNKKSDIAKLVTCKCGVCTHLKVE